MATTYAEKRRKPDWQKKRLTILNRDKWTCQLCKDNLTELHVHHKYYTKGAEPWEYPDEALISYCKHCHHLVELLKKEGLQVVDINRLTREESSLFIFLVSFPMEDKTSYGIFSYIYDVATNIYTPVEGLTYNMFISIKGLFERNNIVDNKIQHNGE